MTDIDVQRLLEPVSAQLPCGKNLEYAPEFIQLTELARGKPEQQAIDGQSRQAQEPAWSKVQEEAELLFGTTKDLRVAGLLHTALLKNERLRGLNASLALTHGLLERYWDHLYPPLDAEDDNDPTFRVNTLVASLSGDEALALVRQMPLVESRQFGTQTLRQYRIVTGAIKTGSADAVKEHAEGLAQLEAAFQNADIGVLKSSAQAGADAAGHLNAIEKILLDRTGGLPDGLAQLRADLADINKLFMAQLARRGALPVPAGPGGAVSPSDEGPAVAVQGEIRSRADVVRTLDALCDYYARNEPSSPVPMLLTRAKRLVDKGFMEIMRDLAPAGVSEAELIAGPEKKE